MLQTSKTEGSASTGETYVQQWRRFAVRHHLALFLLYGWVPACIGLLLLSRYGLHQPVLCLALMGAWLAAAIASVWWAGEFRCPRCRRRYGALGRNRSVNVTRGLFDKICSNCKLKKFED